MSNETDKPLAGALRAARVLDCKIEDDELGQCTCDLEDGADCPACVQIASIIARESGLMELVEAVERAYLDEENTPLGRVTIDANDWRLIVAAARRVREG